MKNIGMTWCHVVAVCFFGLLFLVGERAQAQTPGGTSVPSTFTASYSDGSTAYNTTSNTVTITVANVAGLAITPDAGTVANVAPGQTGVSFIFTLTNSGNITDQVRFGANGASLRVVGPGTITAAVIDVDNSNTVNAGDTDILTNVAAVTSANILLGATIKVIAVVSVSGSATASQTVQVLLGDATGGSPSYDSQNADSSANEVRTVTAGTVNGLQEARGDITATVENDAQLRLTFSAPSGPVSLGTDITFSSLQLENTGARAATARTLTNGPVGANSGVFIIFPIPTDTVLKSGQSFPAGTLYTTDALTTTPLLANWSSTAPGTLSSVTRIAFNLGSSLAAGATSTALSLIVTSQSSHNASVPLKSIADAFALNSLSAAITDQSGDTSINAGDGNADFTEGSAAGSVDGDGVVQTTSWTMVGAVLLGPSGQPGAIGSTDTNDDYTNLSINTGIATVAPGGNTTASGTVVFTNSLQNTGNGNDTYTITAPTVPTGATVEASTNSGTSYTTISGGGSTTMAVNFQQTGTLLIRVTVPSGKTVLTGYATTIRATSGNTTSATNDTVVRTYTGYTQVVNAGTVSNSTGIGGSTDAVPGAEVAYTATFQNVTTSGGTNNATINSSSIILIGAIPSYTDFKVSSAASSPPGGVTVAYAYSNDGGSTYTYTPASGGGSAPSGYDRNVTHVRYTLTGNVTPGSSGTIGMTVRIR